MNTQPQHRPALLWAIVLVLMLFLQGCAGASSPAPTAVSGNLPAETEKAAAEAPAANMPAANMPAADLPAAETLVAEQPAEQPAPAPTATPEPTETPAIAPQIIQQGFGQNGRTVWYAFLIKNANSDAAFDRIPYEVTVFDSAGNVILSDAVRSTSVLHPAETRGEAGRLRLEEGLTASKVEITLKDSPAIATTVPPPVIGADGDYFPAPSEYSGESVTALLTNQTGHLLISIDLSVVGFDVDGNIVGGGNDNAGSIPPGETIGIYTIYEGSEVPARVAVYPGLFRFANLPQEEPPAAGPQLTLEKFGYGVTAKGSMVGYGALIHNPNTEPLRGNINIRFYDQNDVLVQVEEHNYTAGAEQTLGIADDFSIEEGSSIARAEVVVWVDNWQDKLNLTEYPAEVKNIENKAGYITAEGEVTNPTASAVENLVVYAIAFDQSGEIIGGARGYVNIAAGESLSKKFRLVVSAPPASVRLFTLLNK